MTWQLADIEQSGEFLHYIFTAWSINKVLSEPFQQKTLYAPVAAQQLCLSLHEEFLLRRKEIS